MCTSSSGGSRALVRVIVFGTPQGAVKCNCDVAGGNGSSMSLVEMVSIMGRKLKGMFGERVDIELIDVTSEQMINYPLVAEIVDNQQYPLPIVVVDGNICSVGDISLPVVVASIGLAG